MRPSFLSARSQRRGEPGGSERKKRRSLPSRAPAPSSASFPTPAAFPRNQGWVEPFSKRSHEFRAEFVFFKCRTFEPNTLLPQYLPPCHGMPFFAANTLEKTRQNFKIDHTSMFSRSPMRSRFFERTQNAHLENLRWKHGNLGSLKTYLQSYRCTDANPTKNWRPSDLQPINACTWSIPQRGRTEIPSTKNQKFQQKMRTKDITWGNTLNTRARWRRGGMEADKTN